MLEYLSKLLEYLEYYNRMAPFPVYDTEYVGIIREKLKKMEKNKEKIDYNKLPTASCKYCNNLRIEVDELDNDICMRCGSVNDLIIHASYYDYEDYLKKIRKSDGVD